MSDVQREDVTAANGKTGLVTERDADLRDRLSQALWDAGLGGCNNPQCGDEWHGTTCDGCLWTIEQGVNAVMEVLSGPVACPATSEGLGGYQYTCTLPAGHEGHHHDPSDANWLPREHSDG